MHSTFDSYDAGYPPAFFCAFASAVRCPTLKVHAMFEEEGMPVDRIMAIRSSEPLSDPVPVPGPIPVPQPLPDPPPIDPDPIIDPPPHVHLQ